MVVVATFFSPVEVPNMMNSFFFYRLTLTYFCSSTHGAHLYNLLIYYALLPRLYQEWTAHTAKCHPHNNGQWYWMNESMCVREESACSFLSCNQFQVSNTLNLLLEGNQILAVKSAVYLSYQEQLHYRLGTVSFFRNKVSVVVWCKSYYKSSSVCLFVCLSVCSLSPPRSFDRSSPNFVGVCRWTSELPLRGSFSKRSTARRVNGSLSLSTILYMCQPHSTQLQKATLLLLHLIRLKGTFCCIDGWWVYVGGSRNCLLHG